MNTSAPVPGTQRRPKNSVEQRHRPCVFCARGVHPRIRNGCSDRPGSSLPPRGLQTWSLRPAHACCVRRPPPKTCAEKAWAASGHGLPVAKDDPRLVSRGCKRIHLGTALTVGRQFGVEKVRTGFAVEPGEVIQLSLAGPLHPAASQDFPGHHLLGVRSCDICVAARAIFGTSVHTG